MAVYERLITNCVRLSDLASNVGKGLNDPLGLYGRRQLASQLGLQVFAAVV